MKYRSAARRGNEDGMNQLFLESGTVSLTKKEESLCGDFYHIVKEKDKMTVVLSDGLGSGVKANILATLTSKILATLLSRNLPVEECVYTVASTLPMCRERKIAYATFTAVQIENDTARLIQYDNPRAILLRNGKNLNYSAGRTFVDTKEIYESTIYLEEGDMLILLTDGVTAAGLGKTNPSGWKREEIIEFAESWYEPDMSAQRMAALIADAAFSLCLAENEDDTTVMVLRARERKAVNVLAGPPENKEDDNKILRLFFAKEGRHIVCGGTTAATVSKYLGKPVVLLSETATEEIPAMSRLAGTDLVTEGVITLRSLVEFAKRYEKNQMLSLELRERKDGAAELAGYLLEEATDITIYFGRAVNTAHQGLDIDFEEKLNAVRELEEVLTRLGKNVKVSMC